MGARFGHRQSGDAGRQRTESREEILSYFGCLFREKLVREWSYVWDALISNSSDLYPAELLDDIGRAFGAGLVDASFIGLEDVHRTLALGKERSSRQACRQSPSTVKSGRGSLSEVAADLGVSRQALDQYANGSVPASDVLLMAFLKWGWVVKVEDHHGQPSWCEFSVSDMEGGVKTRKRAPVQLSLFDALTDLDQNMDTLKRSVGRVEFRDRKGLRKNGIAKTRPASMLARHPSAARRPLTSQYKCSMI